MKNQHAKRRQGAQTVQPRIKVHKFTFPSKSGTILTTATAIALVRFTSTRSIKRQSLDFHQANYRFNLH
jgi:hypothetical protein